MRPCLLLQLLFFRCFVVSTFVWVDVVVAFSGVSMDVVVDLTVVGLV